MRISAEDHQILNKKKKALVTSKLPLEVGISSPRTYLLRGIVSECPLEWTCYALTSPWVGSDTIWCLLAREVWQTKDLISGVDLL